MAQQKIGIVDDPDLERQLLGLEEIRTPNGSIDIRPPGSSKDDMAISVVLAAFKLSDIAVRPALFVLGEIERAASLGLIPENCGLAAIRANFPQCMDADICLKFRGDSV